MNQGSRQLQTQAQQQVQTLSPQQILAVKLLELPALEIEDRVRAELLENPALEEGREEPESAEESTPDELNENMGEDGGEADYDAEADFRNEEDIPDYYMRDNNRSADDQPKEIPYAEDTSFYEMLKEQLREHEMSERQRQLAEYLIGSLDDDGLLRKSLSALSDELAIYAGVDASVEELKEALQVIQQLDPPGVGASSLQECLMMQLQRKIQQHELPADLVEPATQILESCYDDFTRKRWDKIAKQLQLSEEMVGRAVDEIKKLNPRPGASLGESLERNLQQITPDFIVETDDEGGITMTLNNGRLPELHVSRDFSRMMEEQKPGSGSKPTREQKEALLFLKQKMDAAQGFIDAVKQRQQTLTVTMEALIELQRPFFLEGDEALLRPMILKDVAERTHLDISTISRVSNSKYVQTNFGIYPLKFFFNDSYTTEEGEERSVREIKLYLKECIEGEDRNHPLTDDELCERLKEKGYPIARRTVAKYRQQLNIPVARLRR